MSSEEENAHRRLRRKRSGYAGATALGLAWVTREGKRVNSWGDSVAGVPLTLSAPRWDARVGVLTHNARGEAVKSLRGEDRWGCIPARSMPLAGPRIVSTFPQETPAASQRSSTEDL